MPDSTAALEKEQDNYLLTLSTSRPIGTRNETSEDGGTFFTSSRIFA
jgi:hypothetical protein